MKKLFVLGPILPEWSEICFILDTLQFLNKQYVIDVFDPLDPLTDEVCRETFFAEWKTKIEQVIHQYDAYFGFSLGGVILQKNFDILERYHKKTVLFSTPAYLDKLLTDKIKDIISLIKKKETIAAINKKNSYVFYPYAPPYQVQELTNPDLAAFRLLNGLQFILQTDCRNAVEKTSANYLIFIGEYSQLVNTFNVIATASGYIHIVPQAGMRVLHDNLAYCKRPIIQFLKAR